MRFLKMLFGGAADPTCEFEPATTRTLEWDTAKKTLNGVAFGDPVEALKSLGPASQHCVLDSRSHALIYAEIGLFLDLDPEGRLDYFGVLVGFDEASLKQAGAQEMKFGALHLAHGSRLWDASSTREDFVAFFGEQPYRRDTNGREDIWFFNPSDIEFEFEFEPAGGPLKRINLYPSV